jgi:hypothetical protein
VNLYAGSSAVLAWLLDENSAAAKAEELEAGGLFKRQKATTPALRKGSGDGGAGRS